MKIIKGLCLYFDIDQTLLVFGQDNHPDSIEIIRNGVKLKVVPHKEHIALVRQSKFRGHRVIIWSAGGAEFASYVVKLLKIEKYVDLIISKPAWFVDDRRADFFMPESNRIYYPTVEFKEKKKK